MISPSTGTRLVMFYVSNVQRVDMEIHKTQSLLFIDFIKRTKASEYTAIGIS